MALSSNLIYFILFTALLLPLHQTNARESQFFSKVTNENNNKETRVVPNKEDPVNKAEQNQEQPGFIPETTENSYGLYGHDESNNIPFTKTYKTTTEFEDTNKYNNNNNNNKYFNYDNNNDNAYYNNNNDNAYYNNNNNNQNEFSNTRVTGTGYYSNNNNNNNNNFQNEFSDTKYTEGYSGYNSLDNQMYNNNKNERYTYNNNNNNNRYNGERQGMSDTRFMEGGKYFFDTVSNYNKPLHGDAYKGFNNDNWYNNNNNYNEYQQNQENFQDEP